MQAPIQFFSHEIEFQLPAEDSVARWILRILSDKRRSAGPISYIFCSDSYLLELNQAHLEHDYYTDILTFPYSDPADLIIRSDIYISIERVRENAENLQIEFLDELHRVMVHGILHLLGIDDHGEQAQKNMRREEDFALSLRDF